MMSKRIAALTLFALLASVSLWGAGCGDAPAPAGQPAGDAPPAAEQAGGARGTVVMNGRSVMQGWMSHLGDLGEGRAAWGGYDLRYGELDGGNIVESFTSNVAELDAGSVVFFKFCFVDFDGSNLQERRREVEELVRVAGERRLRLIIGNALPVIEEDGSEGMLAEYRAFNAFLVEKEAQNPGAVWVYDFYGVLAGDDGWLKPEYRTEDSHPNDDAYMELDETFFPLLDRVFGVTAE